MFSLPHPTPSPQARFASAESAYGRFMTSLAGDETRQATRQVSDIHAMVWPRLSLKTLPSQQGPWKGRQNRLGHSLFARTKVELGGRHQRQLLTRLCWAKAEGDHSFLTSHTQFRLALHGRAGERNS